MLLPALNRSRLSAKSIACLNNQKNLYLIMDQYEEESAKNYYVAGIRFSENWALQMKKAGCLPQNTNYPKVIRCPGQTRSHTANNKVYRAPEVTIGATFDYGVNSYIHPLFTTKADSVKPTMRKHRLSQPAAVMKFADTKQYWVNYDYYKYFSFTHANKLNVAYQDGHAGSKNHFAQESIPKDNVFWASDTKWHK